MFCVLLYKYKYMYKSISYFETKPRQAYPTVYKPVKNSTPPHPPPQKNKYIRSIISFADRKSGQMRRPTNAFDLVVGIAKGISTLAN